VAILICDKTGTLTVGCPQVLEVRGLGDLGEQEVLRVAAAVEARSEHPLAAALLAEARARGLQVPDAADFCAVVGGGVSAVVEGHRVQVGSASWLQAEGVGLGESLLEDPPAGSTLIWVAVDGNPVGRMALGDPVKEESAGVLRELEACGVKVIMATGDGEEAARSVAGKLGVGEVHWGLSPVGKMDLVRNHQKRGSRVAMAGDGINDAPALAAADAGLAMGPGTDLAKLSAGVVIMDGDFAGVLRALKLSRATMRNVRQNLWFAFLYNGIGIPIAGGALFPLFGVMLSPMLAGIAMSLSSVSVVLNALRLGRGSFAGAK
jgi:Cu+-exporting ATPase